MPNAFNQLGRSVIGPALGSVAITPLDATSLDTPIHAITLNAAGTLAGINSDVATRATVCFPSVPIRFLPPAFSQPAPRRTV